ncbi:MAG: hypothetical protein V7K94_27165 [Nostoc sp.]
MATNWLRITHQNDKIQLSWQRGYENPRLAPAVRRKPVSSYLARGDR